MDSSTNILYVSTRTCPKVSSHFEIPTNWSGQYPEDFIIGFASSKDMQILNKSLMSPFCLFLIIICYMVGYVSISF
jgi:hypothetical protein